MVARLMLFCFFLMITLISQAFTDPTRPSGYDAVPVVVAKDISVDAIVYDHRRYVAVINGEMHKQGDVVKGYRIVSIQPYAVRLEGVEGIVVKRMVPKIKP